ncbi:hypothetical protein [Bradyrhizobium sp. Cp5.3]|uniref:hypothetical protein n=1 Tax=Bradyrhizobium sp. Cp5.3 TaxID=443598 RepID=UPI0003F4CE58|nr:hypothetical protein [Bradyrhizobium sp. Cp5.3]
MKDLGYYWFSTQFQTPGLATQLYRCEDFARFLSKESLAEIEAVRRDTRPAIVATVLWVAMAVALFFISAWRPIN